MNMHMNMKCQHESICMVDIQLRAIARILISWGGGGGGARTLILLFPCKQVTFQIKFILITLKMNPIKIDNFEYHLKRNLLGNTFMSPLPLFNILAMTLIKLLSKEFLHKKHSMNQYALQSLYICILKAFLRTTLISHLFNTGGKLWRGQTKKILKYQPPFKS